MDYRAERFKLVEWLRSQLIGPANAGDSLHGLQPLEHYHCGLLYPVINDEEGLDPVSESAEAEDEDDYSGLLDEPGDNDKVIDTKNRRHYVAPSAVGFSFYAQGDDIQFHVRYSAARYIKTEDRNELGQFSSEYKRIKLGGDEEAITFTGSNRVDVLYLNGEYLAGLDVQWRPFANVWIITVSLFNKQVWSLENRLAKTRQIKQGMMQELLTGRIRLV